MKWNKEDLIFMKKAYKLAKYIKGNVSPNPAVGAVIVKNGYLIGQGYTQKVGYNHAEIEAINSVKSRDDIIGSTLYTTLEPCSFYGKTPPCIVEIIKSKIKKVIIGSIDYNPKVNGIGIQKLKEKNIEIKIGLLDKKIQKLNEDFNFFIQNTLPFGIAKYAITLDGKMALPISKKWISSKESRIYTHRLRNQVDAILVGTNTVLIDNPRLNVRLKKKWKDPIRIILDPSMKIPFSAKVLNDHLNTILVIKKSFIDKNLENRKKLDRILSIENKRVFIDPTPSDIIDLFWLFKELAKENILSILIEGGSAVLSSALDLKLINKILCFISLEKVVGSYGLAPFNLKYKNPKENFYTLKDSIFKKVGKDLLISTYVKY